MPVPTANVVQGTTAAGNAEGSCTLIWFRLTCPGVKPTNSGDKRIITGAVGGVVLITPVRILNGRDGSAFGRKSYWSSSVRTEPRLAGPSTGAGVGVALPVFTGGVVCPSPKA